MRRVACCRPRLWKVSCTHNHEHSQSNQTSPPGCFLESGAKPTQMMKPNSKLKQLFRSATAAMLAAMALAAAVPGHAQFINGAFIKGANLAWLDGAYNTWLALDPTETGWGCAYNSAHMNQYLADMHNMGITVVRIWINEGDMGCTIDGSDNVTGVTSLCWANLDNCVQLAGNNGVKLYITLNNGRADWLNNPSQANAYKNNALIPLVQRYKGNGNIFAIDLMNEIDGVVGGSEGNYGSGPSWAQAQAYISNFAAAVHSADSGRKVSCSTGWHQWNNLSYFKGLGLDFYDFHYYGDTPSFPSAASLGMDKPIYIGECGQSTATWSDAIQSTCELDALNSAYNEGYAGVGIWDYEYPGSTDYLAMVNANGSNREVCSTIQNWQPPGGGGGGGAIANGTYEIVNLGSGQCLDVDAAGTANGTLIDQYPYGGNTWQQWTLTKQSGGWYQIIGVASGKSLDISNAGTINGTSVDLWPYSGNANQQFTITATSGGYYRITPGNATGSCVEVNGNSDADGALVQIWTYGAATGQQWKFVAE